MVLGEFLRSLFSNKRQSYEEDKRSDVGVTGLPRNIESDFLKHREKDLDEPVQHEFWSREWNQPYQEHYQILMGPENSWDHDHHDSFPMPHNIFQELDEMMQQMFSSFGRFGFEEQLPNVGGLEGMFEDQGQRIDDDSKSLRDKMLKDPHDDGISVFKNFEIPLAEKEDENGRNPRPMMERPWKFPFGSNDRRPMIQDYKDNDFDSEIESGKSKLSDILDREVAPPEDHNNSTKNFSFGSFSSTITKKRADGIIESQKTVKDSKGNEEITVIRKIGDQTHKKTTIKDSDGNEETTEDLMNMDQGDLEKFEKAWSKSEVKGERIPPTMWNSDFGRGSMLSESLYDSIKDLFSPWNKNE